MNEIDREKIREEIRKYQREYYKRNKEKVKAAQERYWLKKAREAEQRKKEV